MVRKLAIRIGRSVKRTVKSSYKGWLFAAPLILGLAIFTVYPVISSFVYSFFDYDGVTKFDFVGLSNYIRIFTSDNRMPVIIKNTVLYAVISVPLNLLLSYFLALMVKKNTRGNRAFRVLFYSPVIIPGIVGGLLWSDMFNSNFGVFNQLLRLVTGNEDFKFMFFEHAKTALASVFIMNSWSVGGGMVLWISAFNNIPDSLYEAAELDGAGRLRKFWHITVPMSTPMIFFNMVMSIIGSLQYSGTLTFAVGDGKGPDNALYFYGVKIFHEYARRYDYGYASALAWVLLLVVGALTLILFKTSNRWVVYGEKT
jgi:multiple sugar transport system permease protein